MYKSPRAPRLRVSKICVLRVLRASKIILHVLRVLRASQLIMPADITAQHLLPVRPVVRPAVPQPQRVADPLAP